MSDTVSLPLWLAILLGILAAWAALDRLLIPSVRWVLRRRVNRVLEEINTRLKIRIAPFELTKRDVLIDRFMRVGYRSAALNYTVPPILAAARATAVGEPNVNHRVWPVE